MYQQDPEVFFGPSVFGEAWGTNAKKEHMFRKIIVLWPCRLRRQGQQTTLFLNCVVCLAFVPQASKKTLGQHKHLGTPLMHVDLMQFDPPLRVCSPGTPAGGLAPPRPPAKINTKMPYEDHPAVLQVKIKIKTRFPSGSEPKSAPNHRSQ